MHPADTPARGGHDRHPARCRLIAAARELAAERGYRALRVSALASAAGLSRQTFYVHFADKQACLAAASDPDLAAIDERLRKAGEAGRSWAKPIRAQVARALVELYPLPQVPDSPRARAIEAMLDCVGERGYRGADLGRVAAAAGLSKIELRGLFASKRELFAAACAQLIAWLWAEHRPSADGDHRARAEIALRELTRELATAPADARILLLEIGELGPKRGGDELPASADSFAELVERLIFGERGPAGGRRDRRDHARRRAAWRLRSPGRARRGADVDRGFSAPKLRTMPMETARTGLSPRQSQREVTTFLRV